MCFSLDKVGLIESYWGQTAEIGNSPGNQGRLVTPLHDEDTNIASQKKK